MFRNFFQLTTQTALSPPGIFLLSSITEILEMAGVKAAIESGQLKAELFNICPGFSGFHDEEKDEMIYTRLERADGLPYDMNIEDALKKKMIPVVNVSGLGDGSSKVTTHAMAAYGLRYNSEEFVEIHKLHWFLLSIYIIYLV